MRNGKEIQDAILSWRTFKGLSYDQAGRMLSPITVIAGSTISAWENGKVKNIRATNWKVLEPLISPYLIRR